MHSTTSYVNVPSPMTTLMTCLDPSDSLSVTIFHPILAEFKYDLDDLFTVEPT